MFEIVNTDTGVILLPTLNSFSACAIVKYQATVAFRPATATCVLELRAECRKHIQASQ